MGLKANREQGLQMTDFAQRRTMMVDTQVRPNEVTSYPVIEAMLTVPREQFVPDSPPGRRLCREQYRTGPRPRAAGAADAGQDDRRWTFRMTIWCWISAAATAMPPR